MKMAIIKNESFWGIYTCYDNCNWNDTNIPLNSKYEAEDLLDIIINFLKSKGHDVEKDDY